MSNGTSARKVIDVIDAQSYEAGYTAGYSEAESKSYEEGYQACRLEFKQKNKRTKTTENHGKKAPVIFSEAEGNRRFYVGSNDLCGQTFGR